jgi:hypothetical protein
LPGSLRLHSPRCGRASAARKEDAIVGDLVSEIGNLRSEFQHIADLHPWVSLAMPLWGKVGLPTIGELVEPSAPPSEPPSKILDGSGQPVSPSKPTLEERAAYWKSVGAVRFRDEHGRERDASIEEVAKFIQDLESPDRMLDVYGPPPWVMSPKNLKRCRVTEHVAALTWNAERLLLRVLDGPNQIPSDIQEQIRERQKECEWYGWMHWLQYSVAIHGPHYRIENYPQVAATALMELRDVVGAETKAITPAATVTAERPAGAGAQAEGKDGESTVDARNVTPAPTVKAGDDDAKDGPTREGYFYFEATLYPFATPQWRLLKALYGKGSVPIESIAKEVYEDKEGIEGKLKKLVSDTGVKLLKHKLPYEINSPMAGHYELKKIPPGYPTFWCRFLAPWKGKGEARTLVS